MNIYLKRRISDESFKKNIYEMGNLLEHQEHKLTSWGCKFWYIFLLFIDASLTVVHFFLTLTPFFSPLHINILKLLKNVPSHSKYLEIFLLPMTTKMLTSKWSKILYHHFTLPKAHPIFNFAQNSIILRSSNNFIFSLLNIKIDFLHHLL